MNQAAGTIFVVALGAIATAYLIKCNESKINIDSENATVESEVEMYYCEENFIYTEIPGLLR